MNSISQHRFNQLKENVLVTAGISQILPSDCKALSEIIFLKTNMLISTTTLKRIYGFAYSKFNPSTFTIDAMALFCGYKNWEDFCEKQERTSATETHSVIDVSWKSTRQAASKITGYTLQALKNRSGIPYNSTIKRKFIDDHLDTFLQEDFTATALISPAGYGKTIALCHWVDERLEQSMLKGCNDIFLFFSSNVLISNLVTGRNLNDWLSSLLGFGTDGDIISALNNDPDRSGNFYFIIDALDEHRFKDGDYQPLLNKIIDIISLYHPYSWFKVIMTMRVPTWINNKHLIINGHSNWFPGFYTEERKPINVPFFNIDELGELCHKINPTARHTISVETAKILEMPLYFQFYYHSNAEQFCVKKIDQISMHELISTYVLNKIYFGPHATEKQLLIQGLIEAMDFKNNKFVVNNLKANDLITKYQNAYNDLLSLGYLREINESDSLKFDVHTEFSNTHFFGHAAAQVALFKNEYEFNTDLIDRINSMFVDSNRKLAILKWCIIYAIKNGQHSNLKYIAQAQLQPAEKAYLLIFIAELFEREFLTVPEVIENLFSQDQGDDLFEYFFGIELINTEYENSLKTLLKFKLSAQKRISVYTSLAIIAIIQMDIDKLDDLMTVLQSFGAEDFDVFPLNPLHCLETVYAYLKHGVIKTGALAELTKFYFNPPSLSKSQTRSSGVNDMLYLLAVYTLSINHNHHKTLRFINAVNKLYQHEGEHTKAYDFMLNLIMVEAYFSLNKVREGEQIYSKILSEFNEEKTVYTPFMKSLFYLLKVKVMILTGQNPDILQAMKPLVHLADESGYKLIKVHSLVLLLANPQMMQDDPAYHKKIYYDFIKITRASGFRGESFFSGAQPVS